MVNRFAGFSVAGRVKSTGAKKEYVRRALVFVWVCAVLAGLEARAQFPYKVYSNYCVTIVGYRGPGGAVNIPATIDDTVGGLYLVTAIGDRAFESQATITSITIPNSISNIGSSAFFRCTGLSTITLPDSILSIGSGAFSGCTGFTSISIPASVRVLSGSAFSYCRNLTNIDVDPLNPVYTSVDGAVFGEKLETLVRVPPASTGSYEIPNGVITIGDNAFNGCALTNIIIPGSVTSIGVEAF